MQGADLFQHAACTALKGELILHIKDCLQGVRERVVTVAQEIKRVIH